MQKILLSLVIVLMISSCRTQKDVLYLQNIDAINISQDNFTNPTIQRGDVMTIVVNAYDEQLVKPFNLGSGTSNTTNLSTAELNPNSYLVDGDGNIDFPMIGSVVAAGKTRKELSDELKKRISNYIKDPIVNIRIINFKVTMLGEFNNQGVVNSTSDRINLIEAIAKAGGMSYYAIRDSVMLVRTIDGHRKHVFINLHDANLMNSDYYYLRQNDILYALPTKSRAMEFNTKPITSILTILGFATAIIALFK